MEGECALADTAEYAASACTYYLYTTLAVGSYLTRPGDTADHDSYGWTIAPTPVYLADDKAVAIIADIASTMAHY